VIDIGALVNVKEGIQSKRIFHDQEIYELELERIFGRCWLFLTHESLIPNVGDFVAAKMGQDDVIVARQRAGSIKAFLNTCSHRGARVCSAEAGNARSFTCPYHGWSYGLDGALEGVPLEKEVYKNRLDKSIHGLREVAKLESFHGFVYGCFDPEAPNLREYLGDMAWYIESWMDAPGGGVELVGPPSRSILYCNWKTPAENFVGDMYHVGWTHAASLKVTATGPLAAIVGNAGLPAPADDIGFHFTTRSGHGAAVTYASKLSSFPPDGVEMYKDWLERQQPLAEQKLGLLRAQLYESTWDGTIFPNSSFLCGASGASTFKVWVPMGPGAIEVLTWSVVEKGMSEELKAFLVRGTNGAFGTAGMLEADDSDNMETMTQVNRGFITRQGTMSNSMGLGTEREDPQMPGVVSSGSINELSQRGFYRFYQEMLAAESWADVRANDAHWKKAHLER
jgi:naphthalene 1,2-dioxygenase subunit alpha